MDKMQITICNRTYSLRTDECPQRIEEIARKLDKMLTEFTEGMKGRPEYEVLTIAAFDLMQQADNNEAEVRKLQEKLEESEVENKQLLIENMNSASSELYQIAAVKEQENTALRAQIQEYEKTVDSQMSNVFTAGDELSRISAIKEKENAELRERIKELENVWEEYSAKTHASAAEEFMQIAVIKEREISELRTKLLEYEKTWDECVQKIRSEAGDEFAEIAAEREKESNELIAKLLEYEKEWNRHSIEVFESAIAEYKTAVEAKETEYLEQSEMLKNFERTFDDYVKTKARETESMQEEIEALKLKLADLSEDGQLTLV
jgi:DNA repair exonuclease SbcCD ATPase subunit